jgi:hypothetical protein
MPFEQLHIFLIINLCIQAPDMELKAMDCVFPCCTGRILQYAQSRTGQTSSNYTAPVHVADKPTAPIHVLQNQTKLVTFWSTWSNMIPILSPLDPAGHILVELVNHSLNFCPVHISVNLIKHDPNVVPPGDILSPSSLVRKSDNKKRRRKDTVVLIFVPLNPSGPIFVN